MTSARIRLAAKNEGLEYTDGVDVYRFDIRLEDRRWTVFLPGSKGPDYREHRLSAEEEGRILPQIKQFLQHRKYYVLFGPTFPVSFVEHRATTEANTECRE